MDVEDVDAEDDDEGANQAEAGWLAVLGQPQKTPSSHAAVVFGKMLQSPPPLSVVQETVRKVTRYVDTPVTPAARKHRADQSLAVMQKKLEASLNAITEHLESGDPNALAVGGALIRSAWEDANDNRRRILAGRQQFVLKGRKDQDAAKLLEAEEEEKLRKARASFRNQKGGKGKGKGNPFAQNYSSSGRFRSGSRPRWNSKPRGKGKGGEKRGNDEK